MSDDPLDQVRRLYQYDLTPSAHRLAQMIPCDIEQLVQAEEYGHPVLSQEEAIQRATKRLDLTLRAIRQSVIYDIKCRRGEWIAQG